MAQLRAVVFDWGGTITPWHDVDLADLWMTAAKVMAPEHADHLSHSLMAAENEFWRLSASTRGAHSSQLHELMRLGTSMVGIDVEHAVHHSAIDAYLEAWTPHTYARGDAASCLKELREMGLRIGLLSNTHWPREWHERILDRDQLLHLVDERVYTSELAHTKPHKEAFSSILNKLGVSPEDAVMIGDRPIDDISGAKSIGMRAVLIPNDSVPKGDVEPDAKIENLAQLPDVLRSWI